MSIPTKVRELIDGSGNNFHAKVARWFASDGWNIAISPYYMDQSQQKAREIDLIAEKVWPFKGGTFNNTEGDVAVRLFVECKYLPGHSVFWFAEKDRALIKSMICASGEFRPDNIHTEKHHYLSINRVAKLFASSNARGQESEPFYKALNQSINGLVSLRRRPARAFSSNQQRGGFQLTLNFPIVVCSSFSELYAEDFANAQETSLVRENFQLEVQYAYVDPSGHSRDELFLLDIIEYEQLSKFVAAVASDANIAGFFASPN